MLGIDIGEKNRQAAEEIFELFKTPWEYCQAGRRYEVIIADRSRVSESQADLIIIFGSQILESDAEWSPWSIKDDGGLLLRANRMDFPIYGQLLVFGNNETPLVEVKNNRESAGFAAHSVRRRVLRIGYDLFEEVRFLLQEGQPPEFAHFPTLDIHLHNLRCWMLTHGIPVVEIPPTPSGRKFFVCLTHDVDFAGIRNHLCDHTQIGFLWRATLGSLLRVLQKRMPLRKLLRNWKAVLLLPLVYVGIRPDFWIQFQRYMEIEDGLRSTFFFVPIKNREGRAPESRRILRRAVCYDVRKMKPFIDELIAKKFEVQVHGIDSWRNREEGRRERQIINQVTGSRMQGVRMHWLLYDENSPKILEQIGYNYDSSIGYNDAVGFKPGTSQPFRPFDAEKLCELPLVVQDTALFYPDRMNLAEGPAMTLVKSIIGKIESFGGVFTVNWHHRSIAPERLWDDFYMDLIDHLKQRQARFVTADEAVEWFEARRALSFERCDEASEPFGIRVKGPAKPTMVLRAYNPDSVRRSAGVECDNSLPFCDYPLAEHDERLSV